MDLPADNIINYKKCSSCGFDWATREYFLGDPNITMVGYQVNFQELEAGFFLFNHTCGTTLAIPAREFKGFYQGSIFAERLTGSEECPGYCLHECELGPCPAQCECGYVREIIQLIRHWPKD